MKVLVKFNIKSTSSTTAKSLRIAEKLNGLTSSVDNKIMVVEGEGVTPDLTKLIGQVASLAKTEVYIDNEIVDSPREIYNIFSCIKRSYCNGHCTLDGQFFNELLYGLGIAERTGYDCNGLDEFYLKRLYEEASEIIDSNRKNEITINTELLIKAYEKEMLITQKACEKFNSQIIIAKLKDLPRLVNLKKYDYEEGEINREDLINQNELDSDADFGSIKMRDLASLFADEIETRIRNILFEMKLLNK